MPTCLFFSFEEVVFVKNIWLWMDWVYQALSPYFPSNEFGINQYEFNKRSLVVTKFIKIKLIVRLFYETVKYLGI